MNKRKMNNKLNDEEIKYINLLFETMHQKLLNFIGYIFEFKNQDNIYTPPGTNFICINNIMKKFFTTENYSMELIEFRTLIRTELFTSFKNIIKEEYSIKNSNYVKINKDIYLSQLQPYIILIKQLQILITCMHAGAIVHAYTYMYMHMHIYVHVHVHVHVSILIY